MDVSKEKLPGVSEQNLLESTQTYNVKGKKFIVEPVFNEKAEETVGTVLLRLIQSDNSA